MKHKLGCIAVVFVEQVLSRIATIFWVANNSCWKERATIRSYSSGLFCPLSLSLLGRYTIAKNMLTIPSIDLVGVDVAITIEDEVFDKDLENKSSARYKTIEKEVEKEVSEKKWK